MSSSGIFLFFLTFIIASFESEFFEILLVLKNGFATFLYLIIIEFSSAPNTIIMDIKSSQNINITTAARAP